MKNKYEIRGEVTAIFLNSPKYGKMETLISTSKLQRVMEFTESWCAILHESKKMFYVLGHMKINDKKKSIRLHRWITDAPDGMVVDHFNHDTLDNTDSNLRVCTHEQNMQNLKSATERSKSGSLGVCWHKTSNRWRGTIKIGNKSLHLGSFERKEDAEEAVKYARAVHMPWSIEHKTIDLKEAEEKVYKKQRFRSEVRSGVKGISWNTKRGIWYIYFNKNNNKHYVGQTKSLEEAKNMLENYKLNFVDVV